MSMGKLNSCLKVLQVIFCLAGVIFGLLDINLPLQLCGSAASSSEAGYNMDGTWTDDIRPRWCSVLLTISRAPMSSLDNPRPDELADACHQYFTFVHQWHVKDQ